MQAADYERKIKYDWLRLNKTKNMSVENSFINKKVTSNTVNVHL